MIRREETIGERGGLVTFDGFGLPGVIYGIRAADGPVVYVGATVKRIYDRAREHVYDAAAGSQLPVHAWLREQQFRFTVSLLERVAREELGAAEKRWIVRLGPAGLLNQTEGGPGTKGHKWPEARARAMADKLRRGSTFRCEICDAEFWRKPRDIRNGNNRFCSRGCYQIWQRGKPKGAAA